MFGVACFEQFFRFFGNGFEMGELLLVKLGADLDLFGIGFAAEAAEEAEFDPLRSIAG